MRLSRFLLPLAGFALLLPFAPLSGEGPIGAEAASPTITISQLSNYLSRQKAHYPISDAFIEEYQQASGGYIEYAKSMGKTVDKSAHEPDQKWHYFSSWLYRSIDDGTLTWQSSGKSRTYSGFLCPELLLWLFEACGGESALVQNAYDIAVEGKTNGTNLSTTAAAMRKAVPWEGLEANILEGLSEDDPYHVTPAVGEDFKVSGLSYDGYQPGDPVDFEVTLLNASKAISSVTYDGIVIEPGESGRYSFAMPSNDVTLGVNLLDLDAPEPEPDPTLGMLLLADLDFPVEGQGSVSRYTSSFSCSNNGIDFTVSGANNNRNKWEYIAMGTKDSANTASIINTVPIPEPLSAIKLTLSAYQSSAVDEATLYIDGSSDFSNPTRIDLSSIIPVSPAPGDVVVLIPEESQIAGGYYKLEWKTNASVSSNGFLHLDRVQYFGPNKGTLLSIEVANAPTELTAGTLFSFSGQVTASYESGANVLIASGLSFSLNGAAINEGEAIPSSAVGASVPLTITYVDNGISASKTVYLTVHEPSGIDPVLSGSWTGQSDISSFVGTSLSESVDLSSWAFSFTRQSGIVETPSIGLTESDVHIGIYNSTSPESEGTPIGLDYAFEADDDGKYLVAFYEGVRASGSIALSIAKWRSVRQTIENGTIAYDFSSSAKNSTTAMSLETFHSYQTQSDAILVKSEISKIYNNYEETLGGYAKLGTSSLPASICIRLDPGLTITSIALRAKAYNASETSFSVNGKPIEATLEFADYSLSLENGDFEGTNQFTLTTTKRLYVQSFSFRVDGYQEIGKKADALALESYIDRFLHMGDYNENLGYCADKEHAYYKHAKNAFNSLSESQKALFASNDAYLEERARLSAWASANGETFLNGKFIVKDRIRPFFVDESKQSSIWIIVLSTIGILSLGALFFLVEKRKKYRQ